MWGIEGLPADDPRRTEPVFTLTPVPEGTRLQLVETGFAQLAGDLARARAQGQQRDLGHRAGRPGGLPRCRLTPAPAGPANRLRAEQQAVARHLGRLVEAGLVHLDQPSGRRHPYRLDPAPIRAAQRWLATLAHEWDDRLAALRRHLDRPS